MNDEPVMSDEQPIVVTVLQVDDRAGYLRGVHYPNLIFLSTVLRWSVTGNVVSGDDRPSSDVIIRNNDSALDSTADYLADLIESGQVPIFNAHAKLLLASGERVSVINKLRGLDGGNVGGLVDEAGLNYYVGGYQLFQAIQNPALPANCDFGRGGLWHRLMWDAPTAWGGMSDKPLATTVDQGENSLPLTDRAHVSNKLAILNQAAARFWANADKDDRTTHPNKPDVVAWLIERGFSDITAKNGATIIRPEWAPVGCKAKE